MIFKKRNGDGDIPSFEIEKISKTLNVGKKLAEILLSRGYSDTDAIRKYLNPKKQPLHSPFLLSGMREAAARIESAINNSEAVIIYSDYDADGVCSAAILYRYLLSRGLEAIVYLPSRHSEGYGLHIEAIEFLAEEYCPDLIITCDCGISAKSEAEYTLDLGIDIIITDHHELPEELPGCTIVNPKLNPDYPCTSLCGAGVVLKIIQAMSGIEEAMKYIDICAVATIADLVPLVDENRTIAALGIDKLNRSPSLGLKLLIDGLAIESVNSVEIAFKIAPRINAAGRIGDANRAFNILAGDDKEAITALIDELSADNDKRKELCEKIYEEAIAAIRRDDLINNRAIIIKDDNWEKGIIGIVCARISGEFRRPAFLLAKSGDIYKATVRSIESINIYELLSAHSKYFVEFGGHSQAAGFSIQADKIAEFAASVNKYLKENYDDGVYLPTAYYDAEIVNEEMTLELAREIETLEPFGADNPKPVFLLKAQSLNVSCMKNREHLNVNFPDGAQMVAFKSGDYRELLRSNSEKKLLVELSVNNFRNHESLRVNIKAIGNEGLDGLTDSWISDCQRVSQFAYKSGRTEYNVYKNIYDVLEDGIYGNYVIADTLGAYLRFLDAISGRRFFLKEYFSGMNENNYNKIVLSPRMPVNLKFYSRVIFLERPLSEGFISYVREQGCSDIFVPEAAPEYPPFATGREVFSKYFSVIKENERLNSFDFYDYAETVSIGRDINTSQLLFCILVFRELGIVKISKKPYNISIDRTVRNDLSNSELYTKFLRGINNCKA